jgi:hypothetical protein
MYPSLIHADAALARQRDLIAAAAVDRLARDARRGHRIEPTKGSPRSVRRAWLRTATRPAQS